MFGRRENDSIYFLTVGNWDKVSQWCGYLGKILKDETNVSDFQQKKVFIEEIPRTAVVERLQHILWNPECSGVTQLEVG